MARALLLLTLLLGLPWPARAAEWGTIQPGVSTLEQVRERYGGPSKETRAKVEGYDTLRWVYEGSGAPEGVVRMTVDFGLLTPSGFKPSLVRLLTLEPRPLIFGRVTVVQGWGILDGVGTREGLVTFFYKEGLFVIFDKEGENALSLVFSIPQPDPVEKSAPSAAPKQ